MVPTHALERARHPIGIHPKDQRANDSPERDPYTAIYDEGCLEPGANARPLQASHNRLQGPKESFPHLRGNRLKRLGMLLEPMELVGDDL
jgi:hypothetical protein